MAGPMIVDAKGADARVADDSHLTLLGFVLVVLSAISGLLFGYDTGVVSGAMLFIRSEFNLDNLWHEMIVAGTILGALVFSLVGGFSADKFGRRTTVLFAAVMFTSGSFLLGFAPNKELILVGRVVVGFGVGLGSSTTPMYIAESSPPKFRGVLVGCYTVGCTFGQFAASIICALLAHVHGGWRWMMGLAAAPSLVLLVGFAFLPESPRWLVVQRRFSEAERVLVRLCGPVAPVAEELKAIRVACEQQRAETANHANVISQILKTPPVWKALLVGCMLQAYQQLAGINTVMYYSSSILEMAGVGSYSVVLWISSMVAGTNFVCTFIGLYLVDRVGRRPLILASFAGAILSLVLLAVSFLLMDTDAPAVLDVASVGCRALTTCKECVSSPLSCGYCYSNATSSCWAQSSNLPVAGPCVAPADGMAWASGWCPSQYSWIAVLALVLYLVCFAPGMGPLPWIINSEIHVTWARGVSSCLSSSTNWLFNFAVSMMFLSLIEAITAAGTLILFAGIGLSGLVLIWVFLPETKGVPLEEVETLFKEKEQRAKEHYSRRESKISDRPAQI